MANGSVQTLVRAFALLEAVGEHPGGARLCDLSRAVEHRVATAQHHGPAGLRRPYRGWKTLAAGAGPQAAERP